MMETKNVIYVYTNLINGKQYVGQTIDFKRRYNEHKCSSKSYFDRAVSKYGVDNFICHILEAYPNLNKDNVRDKLNERERYYIALLNPSYNLTEGGKAWNHSDYEKEKIRKGVIKFYEGNDEIRKQLSESQKKRWENDDELKLKYSNRMKQDNPMFSEESKRNLSKQISSSGIMYIGKLKNKKCKNGFTYRYDNRDGDVRITFSSTKLGKLLDKLKSKRIDLIITDYNKAKSFLEEGGVNYV